MKKDTFEYRLEQAKAQYQKDHRVGLKYKARHYQDLFHLCTYVPAKDYIQFFNGSLSASVVVKTKKQKETQKKKIYRANRDLAQYAQTLQAARTYAKLHEAEIKLGHLIKYFCKQHDYWLKNDFEVVLTVNGRIVKPHEAFSITNYRGHKKT